MIEWNKTGVWICSKCQKDPLACENLKSEYKSKLKEMGLNQKIRVMTSSCLGQCPEDLQAILVQELNKPGEIFEIDPVNDKEEFFLRLSLTVKS